MASATFGDWNIVRTYTLTPGRRYSFSCRYRLGTASNLVMYVSAADNDYVGVTGTFLGTPSQGVTYCKYGTPYKPLFGASTSSPLGGGLGEDWIFFLGKNSDLGSLHIGGLAWVARLTHHPLTGHARHRRAAGPRSHAVRSSNGPGGEHCGVRQQRRCHPVPGR